MSEIMGPGLYCMDCMEAMKQFPDGYFDLAIVDPPYGINVAGHEAGKIVGGGETLWRQIRILCMGQAQRRRHIKTLSYLRR